MKKSSSRKKIAANRSNSKKSTGPENVISTRFNATKHGLLAAGITELDDPDDYRNTLNRLKELYLVEVEKFVLGRIALGMVRLRRCARLEAEYLTDILNPPTFGDARDLFGVPSRLIDRGIPARITSEKFEPLVTTFQRYETSVENKLFRHMHEAERLRRLIQGEKLPPPVAVDVAVHTDNAGLDSFPESADREAIDGILSEPCDKGEDPSPGVNSPEVEAWVEFDVDTNAGGLVSFVEPPKIELLEGPGFEPLDEESQAIVAPHEGRSRRHDHRTSRMKDCFLTILEARTALLCLPARASETNIRRSRGLFHNVSLTWLPTLNHR